MTLRPGAEPRDHPPHPSRADEAHRTVMHAIRSQAPGGGEEASGAGRGAGTAVGGSERGSAHATPSPRVIVWASAQRPPDPALLSSLRAHGAEVHLCHTPYRVLALATRWAGTSAPSPSARGVLVILCEPESGHLRQLPDVCALLPRYAHRARIWCYHGPDRGGPSRTLRAVTAHDIECWRSAGAPAPPSDPTPTVMPGVSGWAESMARHLAESSSSRSPPPRLRLVEDFSDRPAPPAPASPPSSAVRPTVPATSASPSTPSAPRAPNVAPCDRPRIPGDTPGSDHPRVGDGRIGDGPGRGGSRGGGPSGGTPPSVVTPEELDMLLGPLHTSGGGGAGGAGADSGRSEAGPDRAAPDAAGGAGARGPADRAVP